MWRDALPAQRFAAQNWVRETDVLLVNGGDALYLCHWMKQSGLADLLPSLQDTVWVSPYAGSMVMTPRIGKYFVEWKPPTGEARIISDRTKSALTVAKRRSTRLGNPRYEESVEKARAARNFQEKEN